MRGHRHRLEDALDLVVAEPIGDEALARAPGDEPLRARARGHPLRGDADQAARAALGGDRRAEQRVDLLRRDPRHRRRLVLGIARGDRHLRAPRALALAHLLGHVLGQLLGLEAALAEHHLADDVVDDLLEARHVRALLLRSEVDEAVELGVVELLGAGRADPDDLLDVRHAHARERHLDRPVPTPARRGTARPASAPSTPEATEPLPGVATLRSPRPGEGRSPGRPRDCCAATRDTGGRRWRSTRSWSSSGSTTASRTREADYQLVKDLHTEADLIDAYDAAVIERRDDGKVKIVKKHETPTRVGGVLGGGVGLATGLVVALFPFAADRRRPAGRHHRRRRDPRRGRRPRGGGHEPPRPQGARRAPRRRARPAWSSSPSPTWAPRSSGR